MGNEEYWHCSTQGKDGHSCKSCKDRYEKRERIVDEKQLKEIENYIKHDLHKAKYIEDTMFTATEGKELLNEIYRLKEELKIEREKRSAD